MTATATTIARTKAEREAMLMQVQKAIGAEVRCSGIVPRHREDVEQDVQVAVWQATEKFDATRGVKWSTYAIGVMKNTLKNWKANHHHEDDGSIRNKDSDYFDKFAWPQDQAPSGHHTEDDEPLDDETMGTLATEVRRTLAGGVLSKLGAGHRRLVELVVFDRLSPDQIAVQLGHPLKSVRVNLKAAVRALCRIGFTQHAVSAEEIDNATTSKVPAEQRQRSNELNRKRSHLAVNAQVVNHLDEAARADGFTAELARLDDDTRTVVKALLARDFTIDEAAELLGESRRAVLGKLRKVSAVGRKGATAATVDQGELIAR
ncbi:RNA polymerase sigma factor [Gemmata obscuriglobus]|uniref:RNA polymerase sigma-70 region 2 domain-containing protein n=1 Tax=Gemmata obscuriglobus TaxID=114 RepID=A0A2Z3GXZ7_9BACT|nr:sigma-70 family RNA polymerase sigma factor [Gemmata obscuriglobus]AWM39359.1 hypothetical protein C1280_21810 [Gemmata obscuriglobus]QEG27569.1 RNA polymerase sigma factor [Gemmata obscuriglobus]VTS04659.1 hypothetical protein : : Sigma70_r2 [Gemmata obscuriglobus UQM 2246]